MSQVTKNAPAAGMQINAGFVPQSIGSASQHVGSGVAQSKKARYDKGDEIKNSIAQLLGQDISFPSVGSVDLDVHSSYPHAMTGIPYQIQGTATLISVAVGEYLASFSDPIKAILSTEIHTQARVIITRKYVVGGRAMITPEHAPARTVSIQEDAREVNLVRYGGDIEMNLNLFLRPGDAKEELDMKISAQKRELERVLCETGYDMLMSQGTDLTDAMIRSNPMYSMSGGSTSSEILDAVERVNISQVFGCMSKHPFPIPNILAACKYASQYTIQNAKGSVLILPHGLPDMLRYRVILQWHEVYTRPETMQYEIAGPVVTEKTKGKPVTMEIEKAYSDPSTNLKILIHRPLPNFDAGTAHPDVGMGGLQDDVTVAQFYVIKLDPGNVDKADNGGIIPPGLTSPADLRSLANYSDTSDAHKSAANKQVFGGNYVVDYDRRCWAPAPLPKNITTENALNGCGDFNGTDSIGAILNALFFHVDGTKDPYKSKANGWGLTKANGTPDAEDTAANDAKIRLNNLQDFQTRVAALSPIEAAVASLIFGNVKLLTTSRQLEAGAGKAERGTVTIRDNAAQTGVTVAMFATFVDAILGGAATGANDILDRVQIAVTGAKTVTGGTHYLVMIRRIKATMSSAILAAPGGDTGSLLVGYPFTSVSTSSQEVVKIQMRTYMGSVLKRPENVLVIRNVMFEGIRSGGRVPLIQNPAVATGGQDMCEGDFVYVPIKKEIVNQNPSCLNLNDLLADNTASPLTSLYLALHGVVRVDSDASDTGFAKLSLRAPDEDGYFGFPGRIYRGAQRTINLDGEKVNRNTVYESDNTGHLGKLDSPEGAARLYGSFVYSSNPDPRNHTA